MVILLLQWGSWRWRATVWLLSHDHLELSASSPQKLPEIKKLNSARHAAGSPACCGYRFYISSSDIWGGGLPPKAQVTVFVLENMVKTMSRYSVSKLLNTKICESRANFLFLIEISHVIFALSVNWFNLMMWGWSSCWSIVSSLFSS